MDWIDDVREQLGPTGIRQALLRLHAMAHTVIDAAPITVTSNGESIWELADDLSGELYEMMDRLSEALKMVDKLVALAPDPWSEDAEQEA